MHMAPGTLGADGMASLDLCTVNIPTVLGLTLPSFLVSFLGSILTTCSSDCIIVLNVCCGLRAFLCLPTGKVVRKVHPLVNCGFNTHRVGHIGGVFQLALRSDYIVVLFKAIVYLLTSKRLVKLFAAAPRAVTTNSETLGVVDTNFLISTMSIAASNTVRNLKGNARSLMVSLFHCIIIVVPATCLLSRFVNPSNI